MFVLLGELSRDGFFLVRESQTTPGDYGLSVVYGEEVIHYQIRRHGEDAFFSIGKFIENYNFLLHYIWDLFCYVITPFSTMTPVT